MQRLEDGYTRPARLLDARSLSREAISQQPNANEITAAEPCDDRCPTQDHATVYLSR
jgi:hypothetical protein